MNKVFVFALIVGAAAIASLFVRLETSHSSGGTNAVPEAKRHPHEVLQSSPKPKSEEGSSIPTEEAAPSLHSAADTINQMSVDYIIGKLSGLSEAQRTQLALEIVDLLAARGKLELELATIAKTSSKVTAEIPPYPSAGSSIERTLKESFLEILGEEGPVAWDTLYEELSTLFGGFGRSTQKLEAELLEQNSGLVYYRITRSREWTDGSGQKRRTSANTMVPKKEVAPTDYQLLGPHLAQLNAMPAEASR